MVKPQDSANLQQMLLVQEFRTCQRALLLLQQQQRALLHGDTQQLINQASAVDSTLENLQNINLQRRDLAPRYRLKKLTVTQGYLPSLQDGVKVLRREILITLRSNTTLASRALEQIQAKQSHLVWPVQQTNFPAVFATILDARQALETGDQRAIADVLNDLQALIAHLQELTQLTHEETPATEHPTEHAESSQPVKTKGLLEKIAALHHQQNAYQAVFQSGQRILSPEFT